MGYLDRYDLENSCDKKVLKRLFPGDFSSNSLKFPKMDHFVTIGNVQAWPTCQPHSTYAHAHVDGARSDKPYNNNVMCIVVSERKALRGQEASHQISNNTLQT